MIKKVEHTGIIAVDIEKSIEYYTTIFGFIVRTRGQIRNRKVAFLFHRSQADFEIELIQDIQPQGPYDEKGIVNHLAFTVDHIEEAITFYREQGIEFNSEQPNVSIGGSKNIFFYGPARELLQLVEPGKE